MRALVIGGGSIGTRHLENLVATGLDSLAVVEPLASRRRQLCSDGTTVGFETLRQGLDWDPEVAFVATPTHLHLGQAILAAQAGCHLFIEKPLSHTGDGLTELEQQVREKGLVTLVGCNMRFHPGPAKVKELLEQSAVGRVLFARIHAGSYLPGWRPTQDYRQSYSANASMGGGCLLDCIHEIDLAQWYLGSVKEVFCLAAHLSSLEVDVEDVAVLVCKHASGAISEIHLDYVQRTYERGCQIAGEHGSIFWDFGGPVRWFDARQQSWQTFSQPEGWQVNQMYVDELAHFLGCVRQGEQTTLPVEQAVEVMKIVFAARASAGTGCAVRVEEGFL